MPSSLVQRIRMLLQALFGRFFIASGAGLSGYRQRRKPIKTRRFGDIGGTRRRRVCAIDRPFPVNIWHGFAFLGWLRDSVVARPLTVMAISICGALLAPPSGFAQSDQESRCFPWQE